MVEKPEQTRRLAVGEDEITIDGKPVLVSTKHRLILECFQIQDRVAEAEIAGHAWKNVTARHQTIYKNIKRLEKWDWNSGRRPGHGIG